MLKTTGFREAVIQVGRSGFEPLKSKDSGFTVRPIWPLWNLPVMPRIRLLSHPFQNTRRRSVRMSQQTDSNRRPADYKSAALPTELCWQSGILQNHYPLKEHQGRLSLSENRRKMNGKRPAIPNFGKAKVVK